MKTPTNKAKHDAFEDEIRKLVERICDKIGLSIKAAIIYFIIAWAGFTIGFYLGYHDCAEYLAEQLEKNRATHELDYNPYK